MFATLPVMMVGIPSSVTMSEVGPLPPMVGYTTASSPRSCHVSYRRLTTGESTGVFAGSTPCRSTTSISSKPRSLRWVRINSAQDRGSGRRRA